MDIYVVVFSSNGIIYKNKKDKPLLYLTMWMLLTNLISNEKNQAQEFLFSDFIYMEFKTRQN